VRAGALALWLLLLPGAAAQQRDDDVVDRIAAVVGNKALTGREVIITERDVDLAAKINLLRHSRREAIAVDPKGRLAEIFAVAKRPDVREKALEYLVAQAVVYDEARRLAFQRVRLSEVQKELDDFKAKFVTAEEYERFLSENEITEKDLASLIERTLLADRFSRDSVRLNIPIREDEIREYYLKHQSSPQLAGKTLEQARTMINQLLYEERFPRAWSEWYKELRKRQSVQVLLHYR